jgi:hypothetical protein
MRWFDLSPPPSSGFFIESWALNVGRWTFARSVLVLLGRSFSIGGSSLPRRGPAAAGGSRVTFDPFIEHRTFDGGQPAPGVFRGWTFCLSFLLQFNHYNRLTI